MKLEKRILSLGLATTLVSGLVSGAFAAAPTTANNNVNYFVSADFDTLDDVSINCYNDSTTVSLTDEQSLAVNLDGERGGVIIGDADSKAAFAQNGYDSSRTMIYKAKIKITQELFDAMTETTDGYQNRHIAVEPALVTEDKYEAEVSIGTSQSRAGFIKYNGKLYYADSNRITTSPIEVSVGEWHEMIWKIEPTDTQSQHVGIYIDGAQFKGLADVTALISNGVKIADSLEKALSVTKMVNNTGAGTLYLDDIEVYQSAPSDMAYANHMIYADYTDEVATKNITGTNTSASQVSDDIAKLLGEGNKAYKVTAANNYITLGVANKANKTWAAAGYDANKPLIFKTKFYVSSALLAELDSSSKYIRLVPALYNTDDSFHTNDTINYRYALAKLNGKLVYGDNQSLSYRHTELTADEWHEITFVLNPENQTGGAQKVYIDGTNVTSALKLSDFTGTQFMQTAFSDSFRADAFGISTASGFKPANPFYIDDVEVYQAKNAFTAENNYDGQYSSEVTFSSTVNNALSDDSIITITNSDDTAVDFDYSVTLDDTRTKATVSFEDATEGKTYKINVKSTITDNYYQTISGTKSFEITTPVFVPDDADYANYMIYANYNKSVATKNITNTNTSASQVSDDIALKLGEGNKAYKVTAATSNYVTLGVANKANKTWAEAGYDANKPLIFKTKFYVSEELLSELSDTKNIRFEPMLYNTDNTFALAETMSGTARYALGKVNNQLVYGDSNYYTGRCKVLEVNKWHEITYVLDPENTAGSKQKVYIDGEDVSGNIRLDLMTMNTFDSTFRADAFAIATPSTFKPANPFYIDDVEVYQAKNAFTAENNYDGQYSSEVTFSAPVADGLDGKKVVTITNADDTAVNFDYSVTLDETRTKATVKFYDAADGTAYKINAVAKDNYYQSVSGTKSFEITTPVFVPEHDDALNYMIYANYNKSVATKNITGTNMDISQVSDDITALLGEGNKAYKVTAATNNYVTLGVANKANNTWADAGYDANKPLIFKTKFYVSSALLAELDSSSKYIRLVPALYNGDDTFHTNDTINSRYSLAKLNGKLVYGDNNGFANRCTELTADEWHEITFVLDPENQTGGAQKVYLDGKDVSDALGLYYYTETQFMQTAFSDSFRADAFGISTASGFKPTNSFYIDDVSVYQANEAFAVEFEEPTKDYVKINFSNPVKADASKIAVTNSTGYSVEGTTVSFAADGMSATVNYSLLSGEEYTITVKSGLLDIYYQRLTTDAKRTFSSAKSYNIYIDSWTEITPTTNGVSTNVTLKEGSEGRTAAVLIMAVYDEDDKLIALDTQDITAETDLSIPVEMAATKDCSKADQIKLMLWDNLDNMVPFHQFDTAWTK